MATAIYTHQPPANYSSYHALAPQHHQYPAASSSAASSSSHHSSSHHPSSSSKSSSKSSKMHKESREAREQREMRERGYRLCDQCGAVENPAVARFRLCGGCMTTQYCSQDCQKAHWAAHKALCQHTVAQQHPSSHSSLQHSSPHTHTHGHGHAYAYTPAHAAQHEATVAALRKYTSAHSALLGWAGFQALRLKSVPANIRHSALVVNLTPTSHHHHHHPNSSSSSYNNNSRNAFAFHSTQIRPLAAVLADPLILADIARRAQRSRAAGGVGCLIVVLKVLPPSSHSHSHSHSSSRYGEGGYNGGEGGEYGGYNGEGEGGEGGEINQVVPVEVDRVEGIRWAERADWEAVLREALESGREFRV
ncbi:hypothetical protein PC9H_009341 [Pleurotus ostreatus]|uniref:MYND-type domain-containing protein n=1 Tax=Pleurotus ostreatus TaxID=5322 RepID=A0A8H6ZR69_PLEOS|nr:uncharacterized protein PC9H_009341 [Pleurotus ostreatus]KAF7424041.1 hypothetical protein PC9H_009341 [Pleurotus ostreatus]KAJ8693145.1 hypothetical protein PTI98_010387 [Pleurotus ostreatus]